MLGTQDLRLLFGLQSHWKRSFPKEHFQKPLVQKQFSCWAPSPELPNPPFSQWSLPEMHCTSRCTEFLLLLPSRDGSQEQAAARTSTHILLGLLFCSGTVLEQVEPGQTPSCSPFQGYETSLWNSVLCVCRRSDSTQQGLQHPSLFSH